MRSLLTVLLPVALLSGETAAGSQAYMTIRRQLDRSNERDRERNLRSQETTAMVTTAAVIEQQFRKLSRHCVDSESGITDEELNEKLTNFKDFSLSEPMSKFQKLVVYDYEWNQLCQLLWDRLSTQDAGNELMSDFKAYNKILNSKRWSDAIPRFLTDLFAPPKALYH